MSIAAALVLSPTATADVGSADVAAAQVGLRAQALYVGPSDGHNGPVTTTALRTLAPSIRSIEDARAFFGPYGQYRLGGRVLRPGVVGWDAAAYQYLLAWQGFPSGPIDGAYTDRTAAATRRLQLSLGLTPDGVAGPLTVAAVRRDPPRPPRPLAAPVDVAPSGGFGPRDDRFHAGLDFPAEEGTPVRAAAAGTVRFAGWDSTGYGLLVIVDHGDGLETMYAHLSALKVKAGRPVPSGTVLGRSGATGRSNGPHLHFELRLRDAALDPASAFALGAADPAGRRPAAASKG